MSDDQTDHLFWTDVHQLRRDEPAMMVGGPTRTPCEAHRWVTGVRVTWHGASPFGNPTCREFRGRQCVVCGTFEAAP